MADETKYRRCERLFRNCGIWLVVLVAAALVYLARLAFVARIEDPLGGNRFLTSKTFIPRAQTPEWRAWQKRPSEEGITRYVEYPFLNSLYRPILSAAGGKPAEQNKFAKLIIGRG